MPLDILLTSDLDYLIEGGDFVARESTQQHQSLLLLGAPGEFRQNPDRGVGLALWLLDESPDALRAEIRRQFELDGMTVRSLKIDDDSNVIPDADYPT